MKDTKERVLVIGLSTVKNEEVITSLRAVGIDAVGCTRPDTAAESFDAHDFTVIAFGRAALGPQAQRLKTAFSQQDPHIRFVDAFGPIAARQVVATLRSRSNTPVLLRDLTFVRHEHGGQFTATVFDRCHVTITLYQHPVQDTLKEASLLDADIPEGLMICAVSDAQLTNAYSVVAVANRQEFHHLPFL